MSIPTFKIFVDGKDVATIVGAVQKEQLVEELKKGGEVALIVAQKGLAAGLLTADYFTAVILLILVSSIATPIILKLLYSSDEKKGIVHT